MKTKLLLQTLIALLALPASSFADNSVLLTPEKVRSMMLQNNTGIQSQLFLVYQQKDLLNVARAGLLPTPKAVAQAAMSTGGFSLSGIAFLVPFLLPSNWFNLRMSQHELDAQKSGFYAMELNTYAMLYTLYVTAAADQATLNIAQKSYDNYVDIYNKLQSRRYSGSADAASVAAAEAKVNRSMGMLNNAKRALYADNVAMKIALGLPQNTNILYAYTPVAASPSEGQTLDQVMKRAYQIAPEAQQLRDLILAAQSGKWSGIFSFLSNASVTTSGALTANGEISAVQFPSISYSNHNIGAIQQQDKKLREQEQQIVDNTLYSVRILQNQVLNDQAAIDADIQVYNSLLGNYANGTRDVIDLLNQQANVFEDQIAKIQDQLLLDTFRINFHRVLLSDQFGAIPGCKLSQQNADHGIGDWLGGLFGGGSHVERTVDEACGRVAPKAPAKK